MPIMFQKVGSDKKNMNAHMRRIDFNQNPHKTLWVFLSSQEVNKIVFIGHKGSC